MARVLLGVSLLASAAKGQSQGQIGDWEGPYDWSFQVQGSTVTSPCSFAELSHASLIPAGLYRGDVLMWRNAVDHNCIAPPTADTVQFWIFDPNLQTPQPRLISLHQALSSEIFCGGASWDSMGNLIVVGGNNVTGSDMWFPMETYRFNPLNLGPLTFNLTTGYPKVALLVSSPPWDQLGNLASPRYYPTVLALNSSVPLFSTGVTSGCAPLSSSSQVVIGGPASRHFSSQFYDGNEFWELLPPQATTWSCPLVPTNNTPLTNSDIPTQHDVLYHPTPSTTIPLDVYTQLPSGPTRPKVLLDSYPRAFQVSNDSIFVAGDVSDLSLHTIQSSFPSPGNSWVMKPRTTQTPGLLTWQFYRGPEPGAGGGTTPLDPSMDRYYGTAVLLHKLPVPGGGRDRVLVFGGLTDNAYFSGGGATNLQVLDSVQEVVPLPGTGVGEPFVDGFFQNKAPMLNKRFWMNAVILPTGQVFLNGGNSAFPAVVPALVPEIYDPGLTRLSPGSSLPMKQSNVPAGAQAATPRLYHSLATLLPDGRVFVAGGEGTSPPYANAQFSGELYSPPYLYKGFRPIVRPIPSQATFNSSFDLRATVVLGHSVNLDGVVLLRPAALTHHFDTDQRYIELTILPPTVVSSTATTKTLNIHVTMPSQQLGPAGYYMLFVLETDPSTGDRVPSLAQFIQLQ